MHICELNICEKVRRELQYLNFQVL